MIHVPGGVMRGIVVPPTCMDVTEVTVRDYGGCVSAGACTAPHPISRRFCNWGYDNRRSHPVNCVDWNQAVAYCQSLRKRLPTEWEWEWAARGRRGARVYPWGDDAPSCNVAVMNESGRGCERHRTWQVGSKSPMGDSVDGIKDLAGNVWEWTASSEEGFPVMRGGGWTIYHREYLKVRSRYWSPASYSDVAGGFRCVADPFALP